MLELFFKKRETEFNIFHTTLKAIQLNIPDESWTRTFKEAINSSFKCTKTINIHIHCKQILTLSTKCSFSKKIFLYMCELKSTKAIIFPVLKLQFHLMSKTEEKNYFQITNDTVYIIQKVFQTWRHGQLNALVNSPLNWKYGRGLSVTAETDTFCRICFLQVINFHHEIVLIYNFDHCGRANVITASRIYSF